MPSKAAVPDELTSAIAEFMKSTHSSAIEIYEQAAKQQQLFGYLKSRNVNSNAVARLGQPKPLGHALKSAMIVLGQRPAKRQPRPDLATWLKYLANVYESSPALPKTADKDPKRWPLFPMDKAPWPLLMPLSRPMPLDEAPTFMRNSKGSTVGIAITRMVPIADGRRSYAPNFIPRRGIGGLGPIESCMAACVSPCRELPSTRTVLFVNRPYPRPSRIIRILSPITTGTARGRRILIKRLPVGRRSPMR